jgi:hypothetical protein
MSDHDTPLRTAIEHFLADHDPDARLLPAMGYGYSDCDVMRTHYGAVTYGFIPFRYGDPMVNLTTKHGPDERVLIDDLIFQTRAAIAIARFIGVMRRGHSDGRRADSLIVADYPARVQRRDDRRGTVFVAVPPVLSNLVCAPNALERSGQGGRTTVQRFYEAWVRGGVRCSGGAADVPDGAARQDSGASRAAVPACPQQQLSRGHRAGWTDAESSCTSAAGPRRSTAPARAGSVACR